MVPSGPGLPTVSVSVLCALTGSGSVSVSPCSTTPLLCGSMPSPSDVSTPGARLNGTSVSTVQLAAQPSPPCCTQCTQWPPGQAASLAHAASGCEPPMQTPLPCHSASALHC